MKPEDAARAIAAADGRDTGCQTVPLSNPQPPTELLPRTVLAVPVRAPTRVTEELEEGEEEEEEEEEEEIGFFEGSGGVRVGFGVDPQAPPPPIKSQ